METFQVVSVLDPAIDRERATHEVIREYTDTRDFSKIAPFFKPGSRPVIFTCREVPHKYWEAYVMGGGNDAAKASRAFQCGVVRVENAPNSIGESTGDWEPPKIPGSDIMADEAQERFRPFQREEIGTVIWHRSFLGPSIGATYPLPSTLVGPLESTRLLAASSPNSPAQNSGDQSQRSDAPPQKPETTTPGPESSGSTPGAATAATAPGQ